MAYVPQARASALPGGPLPVLPPSPRRRLATLASERGDDTAFLVATADGFRSRSWAEVEQTVERAAAGLIRSGLRADQVVLSLVPTADVHPELDIALRAIGSVVIHVSEDASEDDIARELADVDVRLVLSRDDRELTRLAGLRFRAAEMLDLGNDSWSRLLALGAERLVMDPDAVNRADRVVDPDGTVARVLLPGSPLGRASSDDGLDTRLPGSGVTLLVGPHADAFVHGVRDAHLAVGGTVVHLADPAALAEVLQLVRPTVLALAPGTASDLSRLMSTVSVPGSRRLRPARARAATVVALRAWFGGNLELLLSATDVSGEVRDAVAGLGAEVVDSLALDLLPADLPVPPLVVMGDVADLPRRSRNEPGRAFQLETERAPQFDEPEESAFVLPSLPLFGGESFLDKLLRSQALEGRK